MLIDQGSEVTLIIERLVQRLKLIRNKESILLIGIGAQHSHRTKGDVSFKLKPCYESDFECSVSAHILPKLTTSIPSAQVYQSSWPHLNGLQMADSKYLSPGEIDLILEAQSDNKVTNHFQRFK